MGRPKKGPIWLIVNADALAQVSESGKRDFEGERKGKAAAASLTLGAIMLEGHSESPAPPAGAPLTVKDAASQLRVSTRRVYEMSAAGELRAFKVGRGLRITPEMLKEYQRQGAIAARRREPFGRPNRCL
jgi:excisionase family DNA binding protein